MKFRHLITVLVLAWLYAPASAEPDGNVGGETKVGNVTDLAPVEQESAVYKQAQPEKDVTAGSEGEVGDVGSPEDALKKTAAPSAKDKDVVPAEEKEAPRAKDLEETRKWLQKEYQALLAMQEEIHRDQRRHLGSDARERLDQKIEEYSKRLGEYEKRGQAYDEDLAVFNALREEEKELRKQLRDTEIQLAKDYESLRMEKVDLDRMAMKDMSRSDREVLAEKLRSYNSRVRDYKKRKEEFQRALESYSARIERALDGS